jgi:hypothetical protein
MRISLVTLCLIATVASSLSACSAESKLDPATNAEIRAIRMQSVQGDKRLLFPGERTVETLSDGNPLWLIQ